MSVKSTLDEYFTLEGKILHTFPVKTSGIYKGTLIRGEKSLKLTKILTDTEKEEIIIPYSMITSLKIAEATRNITIQTEENTYVFIK